MALVAAALIYGTVASVISLFSYLPALAVAESLPPTQPGRRVRVWMTALVLPPVVGVVAAVVGLASVAGDPYGSPHLSSMRPHLCWRWLQSVPDVKWSLNVVAVCLAGLVLTAFARLCGSAARSAWFARRCAELEREGDVCLIGADAPMIATVGVRHSRILLTTGATALLPAEELAAALAHERAHIRRRDNITDLVATAFATVVAFLPTAHLYLRYLREDVERACDDEAARDTDRLAVAAAVTRLAAHAQSAARARLVAPQGMRGKQAAIDAARRALRLAAEPAAGVPAAESSVAAAFLTVGAALAVGLGLLATAGQVRDTVRCLAESLLAALK